MMSPVLSPLLSLPMRTCRLAFRLAVVAAVLALPLTAQAVLAPTKGSQLVSAFTVGACPIKGHVGGNAITVSQMVNGDGLVVPLVIPPKRILVLTELTATTIAEPAGDIVASTIVVGSAATGSAVAARFESVAANGTLVSSFQFPTGIAIRPGSVACVELLNLTHGGFVGFTAFAHGYFAADK